MPGDTSVTRMCVGAGWYCLTAGNQHELTRSAPAGRNSDSEVEFFGSQTPTAKPGFVVLDCLRSFLETRTNVTYPPPPGGNAPGPYGQPNQGPQQPYQGGAPNWSPPPPPARKKKKWPFIVGGIVVLLIIIALATGGGEDNKKSDTASTTTAETSQNDATTQEQGTTSAPAEERDDTVGPNAPARDGKFEFVVTGYQPGVTEVGDNPYFTEQASGQFVLVDVTVKNVADKAQSFSPTDQKLIDAQGREFEVNTTAMIAGSSSDIPVWDKINPGNTVNIQLVFDMPTDATPAQVELHDSMFSGGVKVSLA